MTEVTCIYVENHLPRHTTNKTNSSQSAVIYKYRMLLKAVSSKVFIHLGLTHMVRIWK